MYIRSSNSLYDMGYIICKMLYTLVLLLTSAQPEIYTTYFVSYYMLVSVVFSRNDCKDIVIWLVNEGHCDPNVRDNVGETPLQYACR